MASAPPAVTADTLITIKIQSKGTTKKLKLPLRDLAPQSFEDKLRAILMINPESLHRFERYSDSAGSYVVLNRANTSVYKQLYRAAKAKQKLKLRVVEEPTQEPQQLVDVHTPSVEDVSKAAAEPAAMPAAEPAAPVAAEAEPAPAQPAAVAETSSDEDRSQFPALPGRFPVPTSLLEDNSCVWRYDVDAQLNATLQNMARNHELLERNIARLGASVAEMGMKSEQSSASEASMPEPQALVPMTEEEISQNAAILAEVYGDASAAAVTDAEKDGAEKDLQFKVPPVWDLLSEPVSEGSVPVPISNGHVAFTVCCNACGRTIPDTHYHCSTCEDGDFDLCQSCVDLGVTCFSNEHWMIKRFIKDGAIINSTTERVPVKPKPVAKPVVKPAAKPTTKSRSAPRYSARSMTKPAPKSASKSVRSANDMMVAQMQSEEKLAREERIPRDAYPPSLGSATTVSSLSELLNGVHISQQMRTCNNCIQELQENMFLHCRTCYDFDLCKVCFVLNNHGHHPSHAFAPAVPGTKFEPAVTRLLAAGRGQRHNAVCDGCDDFITGVRHKCLNCPDWDYCASCIENAKVTHPGHRFLPIHEPLRDLTINSNGPRVIHQDIYCDGPHCTVAHRHSQPIVGDRYKCAVCCNVDFCANCEASPANNHNKTHPLIKFKTPVRYVSVTTTGENNGVALPELGDFTMETAPFEPPCSGAPSSCHSFASGIKMHEAHTVLDVEPTMVSAPAVPETAPALAVNTPTAPVDIPAVKPAAKEVDASAEPLPEDLDAMFERDSIEDGTTMPPNHVFEQTWVLRNTGSVAWPAGCCVRFVSGDYMGHVDPNHPAGIQELVSASESTISYEPVAPGAEFPFTVLLRTPTHIGKAISYWRLTSRGGIKFGDRLWCDVTVQPKEEAKTETKTEVKPEVKEEAKAATEKTLEGSEMVFPKLEKESPETSVHYSDARDACESFEFDWAEEEEVDEADGFLTDDEYDILDASDEELYDEPQGKSQKK